MMTTNIKARHPCMPKVLLVDDFESPYFLCRKGYKVTNNDPAAASAIDMEDIWAPVGQVTRSLPLRDQSEVEVNFLCCTEKIYVCNTHVAKITKEEYHVSTCHQ